MRHGHVSAAAAAAALAWAAVASAGPDPKTPYKLDRPKTPTLLRSYSVKVYPFDDRGGSFAQFDGTRGVLRSVTAKLSAVARYTLTANGTAKTGGKPYDFTVYVLAYVADTPASFSLKVHCAGTLTDQVQQPINCPASGETSLSAAQTTLPPFVGAKALFARFKPDPIATYLLPPGIATVEGVPSGLDGTVSYTYLPTVPPYRKPG